MEIIDDLKWRYATKRYSDEIVKDEILDIILDSIVLTPTSLGLQAYEVLVLDKSSSLRESLLSACSNQPQIKEASHLLFFNAWKSVSTENISEYMNRISLTRGTPLEKLEGFKSNIEKFTGGMSEQDVFSWSSMQTYIALGIAMTTAATLKVDTTPMEGFNRKAVDAIINKDNEKLSCSVILAVGYRDSENDFLSNLAKVRKLKNELISFG
jgi:nitroreductase